MPRRLAVVVAAVLLLAGCAPAASPATPVPSPSNGSGASTVVGGLDRVFLHAMTAHQERTLAIVRVAPQRIRQPGLRTLVAAVEATETDEVAQAREWLRAAGPDPGGHRHEHPDPSGAPDPVSRLRDTPAAGYDAVLVAVLVAQQRQAAELARAHLALAASPAVRDLARRIDESRTAQIRLLTALPVARVTP
ncbi:DUF305 domain-containing protein [Micromonospora matsumotoense]|uniref:DUF305 domain-containing protein n=1 Tax=Micromonospora matsumotoense TaxID=121616 RepID=UPI000B84B236|nr:DUF305 domain-containing protein [Micromonospora matsumotoense]